MCFKKCAPGATPESSGGPRPGQGYPEAGQRASGIRSWGLSFKPGVPVAERRPMKAGQGVP